MAASCARSKLSRPLPARNFAPRSSTGLQQCRRRSKLSQQIAVLHRSKTGERSEAERMQTRRLVEREGALLLLRKGSSCRAVTVTARARARDRHSRGREGIEIGRGRHFILGRLFRLATLGIVAALRECVVAFGLALALIATHLGLVSLAPAHAAAVSAADALPREQITLAVKARAYWKNGAEKCRSCVSLGKDQLAATLVKGSHFKEGVLGNMKKATTTTTIKLKKLPRVMGSLKKSKKKSDLVLYSTFYHAVKSGKVLSVRFDDNSPKIYFQLKPKQRLRGPSLQASASSPLLAAEHGVSGESQHWFSTKRVPSDTTLLPLLISKKVSFGSRSSVSSSLGKVVLTAMLLWLPLVPLLLFVRRTIQQQQGMSKSNSKRKNLSGKGGPKDAIPDVTFKDVAGADYAIEELREIVDFLHWKQAQVAERKRAAKKRGVVGGSKYATAFLGSLNVVSLFQRIRHSIRMKREKKKTKKKTENMNGVGFQGKSEDAEAKRVLGTASGGANALNGFIRMPKGVLLSGPPGTGKTLLAKAVAGEASVPFFACSASEFVELFVGRGAARVRDLFKQARRCAPSIVFIDEIDAVGGKRGAGFNEERDQTLNQLLTELDGFNERNSKSKVKGEGDIMGPDVLLMCATNRPEVLDDALLRPGRLSRKVKIGLPDSKGRRDISLVYLAGLPLEPSPLGAVVEVQSHDSSEQSQFENYYAQLIASQTSGCSGADIANVVNEAVLMATRRGAERVAEQDIIAGIERTKNGIKRTSPISSAGLVNNPLLASFEQMIASNIDKMKEKTQQKVVRGHPRMP